VVSGSYFYRSPTIITGSFHTLSDIRREAYLQRILCLKTTTKDNFWSRL